MNDFKKGDILVNTRLQTYPCGAKKLSNNAIVKAHSNTDHHDHTISIFRDKKNEAKYAYYWVNADYLRPATEKEEVMYENGIRHTIAHADA